MPQLRILFTDADISRTRLKLGIDHMWEIVSSVQVLQHNDGGLSFDPWRRHVRRRLSQDGDLRAAVHTLMTVAPHASYFPDFLTPPADTSDIDADVDVVLSTSRRRLRAEISRILPTRRSSADWLEELARGGLASLRHLRRSINTYFEHLVDPYLPVLGDGLRIECADGIQSYVRTGPEGLLRWLAPTATWTPPVLAVDYPLDRELHLDGRGLLLIPSYFCFYHPVALADPHLRPVLVFPIRSESRLLAGAHGGDCVSGLLGATRATILRAVVNGCTTTALAKLVSVSPATISHHTGILRGAGLITTNRHDNFATHLITSLGLDVLSAGRVR